MYGCFMGLVLTDVKQMLFFSNISGTNARRFKNLYTYKQLLQAHIVTRYTVIYSIRDSVDSNQILAK